MNDSDQTAPTVRIAMTTSPIDARRLKQAGLDFDTPAAVVARTLVNYGLDHLGRAPEIDAALTAASAAEKKRRSEAARQGGRRGGGSNKKE